MITNFTNSLAGDYTFVLFGSPVMYSSVTEYELTLSENKHDMLVVTMAGIPPLAVTDYIGAPVSFSLGSSPGRSQTFNGYVSYTEPVTHNRDGVVNDSPIQLARLYCLGASYVMKEINSKVWDYPTLENVVTEIANRHHFSIDYPKDSYNPVRLVQSMESDWSFLNRVCKAFGYSFNVHGTHIHIWDRLKTSGRLPSFHRATTSNKVQSNQPFSVLNFEATLGRISSSSNASKSLITVLDNQSNIHTVTSDGTEFTPGLSSLNKLFKKPLYYSAASLEEGLRTVDSQDKYSPIYNATMRVLYGAGAVPGGIVDLRGYSSEFDGMWYITEVKHSIKSSNYVTDLLISKDSKFEEVSSTSKVTTFSTPPEPSLIDSKWVALTMRSVEYA
jgi:hypothetical protein